MSDKKKHKKSKEEIAREFDLPERKSKIATIMKQDDQAYCVCRSSDSSRFMIGCDGCEEWYHGDCINISEKEAKHIKHYYCQRCKEDDPTLQTVFRIVPAEKIAQPSGSTMVLDAPLKKKKDKSHHSSEPKTSLTRCGQCEGCQRPSCGVCEGCLQKKVGRKPRCLKRVCLYLKKRDRDKEKKLFKSSKKRKRSASPELFANPDLEGIRQCRGPGCRMNCRPQSKYCSDACGLQLAQSRIFQVLPQRIQEWNLSGCRAEDENKKQLEQIRARQAVVRFALAELDKRHAELDLLVERAKRCTLDPKALDTNDIEDEQSMYCITCGHEIHSRTAIRHMEKCFNKYESQASFGSIFKTRIEGNSMFCDFYNQASKTYCKRLRVLCPEHCKDPKISDSDVCGCPLVSNVFNLTGQFCRAPKKNCFKHYVWEKIRRAEIDLERVRQWLKMDELLEQERQIRAGMASRAGVLGLMLHSTYNHEVMEELCRQRKEAVAEQMKIHKQQIAHQIQQLQQNQSPKYERASQHNAKKQKGHYDQRSAQSQHQRQPELPHSIQQNTYSSSSQQKNLGVRAGYSNSSSQNYSDQQKTSKHQNQTNYTNESGRQSVIQQHQQKEKERHNYQQELQYHSQQNRQNVQENQNFHSGYNKFLQTYNSQNKTYNSKQNYNYK